VATAIVALWHIEFGKTVADLDLDPLAVAGHVGAADVDINTGADASDQRGRAAPADADWSSVCKGIEVRNGVAFPGSTVEISPITATSSLDAVAQCCEKCFAIQRCTHWTMQPADSADSAHSKPTCRLKSLKHVGGDLGPPQWDAGTASDPGTLSGRVLNSLAKSSARQSNNNEREAPTPLQQLTTPSRGLVVQLNIEPRTACLTNASDWRADPKALGEATARLPPSLTGGMRDRLAVNRAQQTVDVCGNVAEIPRSVAEVVNLTRPCRLWWEKLKGSLQLGSHVTEPPLCTGPQEMLDRTSGKMDH
jgi:hypothetical protein